MSDSRNSELWIRSLSAVILGPAVIAAVWYGGLAFQIPLLICASIASWEWRMLVGAGALAGDIILVISAPLGVALAYWADPAMAIAATGLCAVLSVALGGGSGGGRIWRGVGPLYLCLPMIALVYLRGGSYAAGIDYSDAGGGEIGGRLAVLLLISVVWATDIGAYAVGRAFGGPKLAPRISPSKTWSGSIGGAAAGGGAGVGFFLVIGEGRTIWILVACLCLAIISQIGDLFESSLKRHFDVKDSGTLIPGHGGILDRIDGLLAASLAMGLAVWFVAIGGS